MTSRVAIITARGGSKRIPRKNIKFFHGKPIIAYSIEAALASDCFDEVMVSTDDKEIALIAKNYGASVPFMRSAKNSDDFTGTADVLMEVITEYINRGINFNQCCCLYPAAPFITSDLLKKTLNIMEEKSASSLIPIAPFPSPIQRALVIKNECLTRLNNEFEKTRSQDLQTTFFDVGQFYWFEVEIFLEKKRLLTEATLPYIVSSKEFQDIDTLDDWDEAEIKYEILQRLAKSTPQQP